MTIIELFKVLGNPVRLRCLVLLHEQQSNSLCVCDLMELLDSTQSKISRHFKQLRDLNIVIFEQREQWVHYRINPDLPENRRKLLQSCLNNAAQESPYREDILRLHQLKNNC